MTKTFRLAIMTDEVSQSPEDAIKLAQEFGLTGVELRSVDGKQLHQLDDARIEEIKAMLQEAKLEVCGLSTPVFKCELDRPEEVEQSLAILRRDLELANRFGCRIIRGFSFWARKPFEEAFDEIVSRIRGIVPLLEEADVVFALEFDPAVYATNAEKTARIVRAVDSPYVRVLFDPGNDLWDPDGEVPYPQGYDHARELMCHIHLKDAVRRDGEVEGVAIGAGEVDYKGLFSALAADGYEGYLVVETHYRLRSKLSEEQLKRPAGYAFSEGGEEASRQCLESLSRLLLELPAYSGQGGTGR
ncbi:Sugar phosphate isomerase/epimerase [Paenibacillus sp. UNCCL117]|uniref:sugar phosphate isomerase/epimerase family protein n=1 Tax=unclassified Paenibacillus TaxID=185978 RepID=UPI00088CA129|nr:MULTISPECIES: sugar phosphate isomerase/epimerase family protein [unclassified Paenibacillus]SDC22955.1 Sugar phosphate isomerase/epimerase [Paenibacillus sp. cl123]SFW19170.1 Sugar phosphate isomerase/epimerase [Paenibacillus sp. UNCCL117]